MRCPKCGHTDDKVLDSRAAREGDAIRRRRACLACNQRFTTYEEIVKDALRVVKRDGRREEFSRLKLMNGIMRACEKRPVSPMQIEEMVDEIMDQIEQEYDSEVPSGVIGEKVMSRLEKIDEVAYVRFASVYKRFADVNQFLNAIHDIVGKS
jgi:transcriptional repressor NrdR